MKRKNIFFKNKKASPPRLGERSSRVKAGMTLIEALLAIMIFTFGIMGFSQLFVKSWQSNQFSYEMGQSTFSVSQGVNKMVDYIRRARQGDDGAYPIKSANDDDFVFFCDYDKDGITERVHIYKSSGKILMGYRKPSTGLPKTYATGDQATLTLAQDIVNDVNTPVFSYYNKNYPGDQTHNPLATPAAVSDIRLVKINLAVDPDVNKAPDSVQMESFVELRNLNDYNGIE